MGQKKYSARYVTGLKNKILWTAARLRKISHFVECSDGVLRPCFGDSTVFCGQENALASPLTAKELRERTLDLIRCVIKVIE